MKQRLLPLLLALSAPTAAHASGFLLYEQSARALALGSAVSASVQDPSAAWFNPAALAFLDGYGAQVTAALVLPHTRFSSAAGPETADSQTGLKVVPNLFLHGRVTDRVQAGLGVYAPFGLIVQWPDGWVGAEQSLMTDLRVIAVNPSASFRFDDRLSVAAGVSLIRGTVKLATALPQPPGGRADLDGGAWGVGGNVAVLFRLRPETLHLAATYRSRFRLPFEGQADFAPQTPGFEQMLYDQPARADITLPDIIAVGGMFRPVPRLELGAEIDWVLWSAFNELHIRFVEQPALDRRVARGSANPFTARAGAEWRLNETLSVRAGASFDQSAVDRETLAPSAPDAQRLGIGAGFGVTFGRLTVDVGYLYAHFLPGEAVAPAKPEGTYRTRAHALAVTAGVGHSPRR